jgi:hypothetical protein
MFSLVSDMNKNFNGYDLVVEQSNTNNHYFCGHKLIHLAGGMQSDRIETGTGRQESNSNTTFSGKKSWTTSHPVAGTNVNDTTLTDSLSIEFLTPDSNIVFAARPELSQFKSAYIPNFNYKRDLVKTFPFDSLQNVLKGVEVVFPGKKIYRNNPDWLVGVMLLAFILFGTVRLIFNKYLSQLFQSLTNYSTFQRMFRERYFSIFHASFRLDVIFNLILALYSYQFLSAYKINFGISQTFALYLACLGLVAGFFFAKRALYGLIGLLTESRQEVQEYLFSIKIHNRMLGLVLLPVTAVLAFVPLAQPELLLFGGLLLIGVFYLFSLARGIKIFLKKHFSVFYLILYLCTLEFLPLLLILGILLR